MFHFREAFNEAAWARLEARGEAVLFPEASLVLRRGQPPSFVYVLLGGALDVVDRRSSPETVLARLAPGDVFGEMSFLAGAPVSADIRAAEESHCLRWSIPHLADLLARDPSLDAAFSKALAVTLTLRTRAASRSAVTGLSSSDDEAVVIERNVGGALLAAVRPLPSRELNLAVEVLARRTQRSTNSIEAGLSDGVKTFGQTLRERPWEDTDLAALLGALMKGLATAVSTARGTADALVALGVDPITAAAAVIPSKPLEPVTLSGERLRVGFWKGCEVVLPDPRIEPIHAEIVRAAEGWRVVSTGRRSVVVGGQAVRSAPLPAEVPVRVGGYLLRLRDGHLHIESPGVPLALRARGLVRRVGRKTLLSEVGFTALAGEVVAVVGPSGAGKSTLLSALRGQTDGGTVTLGSRDFHELLRRAPGLAGEVPQDDIVLPELTVQESVEAACRLRVPRESRRGRRARVERVLDVLGLSEIRDQRIGNPERRGISGGQRKRVNIAQEVLSEDTRVLFLDEPTSGLDPRSSADIARLCRRLADQGRVLFVVTHDLTAPLLSQVDQLLVLAPGGHLAFFGPPHEAAAHFRVAEPAEIFDRLEDRSAEEWAAAYAESPAGSRWVAVRDTFLEVLIPQGDAPAHSRRPSWIAQLSTFTRRTLKVKRRDLGGLVVLAAQPLAVAAIVTMVFVHSPATFFFLVALACLWFGMSASVRELIVDSMVWRREGALGLSASAWVLSKTVVLFGMVGGQTSFLAFAAWLSAEPSVGLSLPGIWAACLVTGWLGVCLGLAVSSLWRRSEAAVGTVLLLLVPQIAFSGALMPLNRVHPVAGWLATLTPLRYATDLMLRCPEQVGYISLGGAWQYRPVRGELVALGLRDPGEHTAWSIPALVALLTLFAGTAWVFAVLRMRFRRG